MIKQFTIGDLVAVPRRTHRYEVTKDYEFAIVMEDVGPFDTQSPCLPLPVDLYLQETGSFAIYTINELIRVK